MSDHYYSRRPTVPSDPKSLNVHLNGRAYQFQSDRGVFSKQGIDFGTRLLIETFVMPDVQGAVADIGCGYGPIGTVVAAEHPERNVWMTDVNERAVELAVKNAGAHQVENVTVVQGNLLEAIQQPCAAILSNPPIRAGKKVVHTLFEQAYESLVAGGELWIVMQKKQGAPSAQDKLASLYQDVQVVAQDKGYKIIVAKKIDC
ncbi:class I SAM-dependent methyltransferase [Aureibacillus halotolerans]|uniref:16S rRNA m(2)G 1207 methyltransferase n=1 Tax=Aureibacillus halotolerans TaxID=1508390 RepID=A0A4R6TR40_9BACI|nr:class I SAM-dependent methyltransferase [Aureibacillus halotolerans]TDQ34700.1 16S rRNA m(2)G 1207 methyltransferase [Aureibacillus halotolerans]